MTKTVYSRTLTCKKGVPSRMQVNKMHYFFESELRFWRKGQVPSGFTPAL
jgi:hypothetical protein